MHRFSRQRKNGNYLCIIMSPSKSANNFIICFALFAHMDIVFSSGGLHTHKQLIKALRTIQMTPHTRKKQRSTIHCSLNNQTIFNLINCFCTANLHIRCPKLSEKQTNNETHIPTNTTTNINVLCADQPGMSKWTLLDVYGNITQSRFKTLRYIFTLPVNTSPILLVRRRCRIIAKNHQHKASAKMLTSKQLRCPIIAYKWVNVYPQHKTIAKISTSKQLRGPIIPYKC